MSLSPRTLLGVQTSLKSSSRQAVRSFLTSSARCNSNTEGLPSSPSQAEPAKPRINSRTPLYGLHVKPEYAGKMVEFAGFDMPLHYQGSNSDKVPGGAVAEHHQVRKSAGLFDVGHMVQSTFSGAGALAFLSRLLPASLDSLPVQKSETDPLKSTLSVLLNSEGGIIDDCMITRWGRNHFYLVTNAGRAERDLAWIRENVDSWNLTREDSVEFSVMENCGLIALQGPQAHKALQRLLPPNTSLQSLLTFGQSMFLRVPSLSSSLHVARGGYTGEDGFEISVPEPRNYGMGGTGTPGTQPQTELLAEMLLDQPEVKLAGLAARDSLRLEAGLCLYGHDLSEEIGVGEAGLAWLVGKDRREPGQFVGVDRTLAELKKGGTTRKRVGLIVEKGAPAREGAKIFTSDGQTEIGVVTSGLPSPTLGQNISMGYIQTKDGLNKKESKVKVEVRKKMREAEVVSMPWITPGYYRG